MNILSFQNYLSCVKNNNQINIKIKSNGKVLQIGQEYYKTNNKFDLERLRDYMAFLKLLRGTNIEEFFIIGPNEIIVYFNKSKSFIEKIERRGDMFIAIIQHK